MIDQTVAGELVKHFKILTRYPKGDGEAALIRAMAVADSQREAEYIVRKWIKENRRCPMPCDLYQLLEKPGRIQSITLGGYPEVPPGKDVPPPQYFCNLCEDTGWFIVMLGSKSWEGSPYSGARRCHHPAESRGLRGRGTSETTHNPN